MFGDYKLFILGLVVGMTRENKMCASRNAQVASDRRSMGHTEKQIYYRIIQLQRASMIRDAAKEDLECVQLEVRSLKNLFGLIEYNLPAEQRKLLHAADVSCQKRIAHMVSAEQWIHHMFMRIDAIADNISDMDRYEQNKQTLGNIRNDVIAKQEYWKQNGYVGTNKKYLRLLREWCFIVKCLDQQQKKL